MSTLHRLQAGLSVRCEAGHVVLVRWHQVQGASIPQDIARLSLRELAEVVCLASEGWERLCSTDQVLRLLAVANIIGGCVPAEKEPAT